ncbi:hypothetical protein TBLA_0E02670 [Henningerozyma blattae CBS 6284]|uniref:Succinate dehydrogenase assembly factor 2, mitochondrial n=1 Tax=Henningerozyma blattae (strain ATCC 34711 / CBS 6284 / DSM 70876 / NBRC 10599 / NRRL Y-10934 / UCD 77-7) TaxID=1071380 RepID=I2H4M1_HENB6|nr:hypothetical protein TBLA_0E02670 [Tetrapisispora blattae CBS 6284]CCH61323.1 hypothetical protein TBLA_0E02670 [Tetrapisispora blattae CBS 6284]
MFKAVSKNLNSGFMASKAARSIWARGAQNHTLNMNTTGTYWYSSGTNVLLQNKKNNEIDQSDDVFSRIRIEPIHRTDEPRDVKIARLTYQSRKRGILETDLLLSRFAKKYLKTMTTEELNEYDALLNELDWDIYYWATKNFDVTPLPKKWENSTILKKLQDFSENTENEIIRMPDL